MHTVVIWQHTTECFWLLQVTHRYCGNKEYALGNTITENFFITPIYA